MRAFLLLLHLIIGTLLLDSCKPNSSVGLDHYKFHADSSHWDNKKVKQLKKEIIDTYKNINDWYINSNHRIWFYDYWRMRGVSRAKNADHEILEYLHTSISDSITEADLLTANFKETLIQRAHATVNPVNLAGLMTQDSAAYVLLNLYEDHFHMYRNYLDIEHNIRKLIEENTGGLAVDVSADSVENCLMEMITMPSSTEAILAVPYYLIQGRFGWNNNYFLFFFIKEEEQWLLDDMRVAKRKYD